MRRLCHRHNTSIEELTNKHWVKLYETMKRARTDIVGTAAAVFGSRKSEHHMAEYAFPLKGPELAGHAVQVRQSLRDSITLEDLILALNGELRKMTSMWRLFVAGCFSGKVRGVAKADPCVVKYSEHIGAETETLIRLELARRFEQQGFCWQKANDGVKNQRYTTFRMMKTRVRECWWGWR